LKLDIFHAYQRIVTTLKKGQQSKLSPVERTKFIREMRVILRKRSDHGNTRLEPTASGDEIKININRLISTWEGKLDTATVTQLRLLETKHSECLSNIPVGIGTMGNENLHKQINAIFHGVRSVGLEVLLARLTTFFYMHNQRIRGLQTERWHSEIQQHQIVMFDYKNFEGLGLCPRQSDDVYPTQPACSMNNTCISSMVQYAETLFKVLDNIQISTLKHHPIELLLYCTYTNFVQPKHEDETGETADVILKDFQLQWTSEDKSFSDAIIEQALYTAKLEGNEDFHAYIDQSNLLSTSVLVVKVRDELRRDRARYSSAFFSSEQFDTYLNSTSLTVDSHAAMTAFTLAASVVLRSTIVLIANSKERKIQTIIPPLQSQLKSLQNNCPLFLLWTSRSRNAFNCTTTSKTESMDIDTKQNEDDDYLVLVHADPNQRCCCGSCRKGVNESCTSQRCPCANKEMLCSEYCKCQQCANPHGKRFIPSKKEKGCRCGVNSVDGKQFCVSTQCPCMKFGYSCDAVPSCSCKNCCNVNGKKECASSSSKMTLTQRESDTIKSSGKLRCISSKTFFEETDQKLIMSIWTDREALLLAIVIQCVQTADMHLSVKKIAELFNLYSNNFTGVRKKTQSQITFKMRYLRKYRRICNK
jgi:hypothetical protein